VTTLKTVVKNHEEIGRTSVHCRPFSKQWKLLKHLLLEELELASAAWFNQVYAENGSVDGTHIKEKALHIADYLGNSQFVFPVVGLTDLRGDRMLFTISTII
jgi:hypothetical protein